MNKTELRTDWLIGYYALGRDKSCTKITFHQKGLTLRACMGDKGSGKWGSWSE